MVPGVDSEEVKDSQYMKEFKAKELRIQAPPLTSLCDPKQLIPTLRVSISLCKNKEQLLRIKLNNKVFSV